MSTTNPMPEQEAVAAPEKKTENPKNQNALLRYITILFAVAFLVVLLSLLISNRQNKDTITALNQTSASALENAEQLQEINRELSDANAILREQVTELELQATQAQEDAAQLKTQLEQAQSQTADTAAAYALLFDAMDARQNGDLEAFNQVMSELEQAKDLLEGDALTRYEELERVWEKAEEE